MGQLWLKDQSRIYTGFDLQRGKIIIYKASDKAESICFEGIGGRGGWEDGGTEDGGTEDGGLEDGGTEHGGMEDEGMQDGGTEDEG